jgi:hypothetical protein
VSVHTVPRSTVGAVGFGGRAAGAVAITNPSDIQGHFEKSWLFIAALSDVGAVTRSTLGEILRALPQALTTRSISTHAPSASAATAIVVRAGKG